MVDGFGAFGKLLFLIPNTLYESGSTSGKSRGLVRSGDRRDAVAAFAFVGANQAMHGIATMCRVLGVSPGGYYARRARPPSARARADAALSMRIAEIHRVSRQTYGVPRIYAELKAQGLRVGRKRVARLMNTAGLYGVSRRRWITTTVRDRAAKPAPDLVERNFTAAAPNRLWVADITYIPTWADFLYLAVVLDAFSRKIVGWAMATHLRTELVLAALNMALGQRRPAGVIHHSDQGSQYTSLAFGQRCDQAGVRPSMGSVGDCFDNAMCESFFATLECELLDRTTFKTQAEAPMAVFDFIEGWYNPRRRHSALDYLSPLDYERAYAPQPGAPCRDQGPLKPSAPPPLAAEKIGDQQDAIKVNKIGESLNQSPSPTLSTETG
jgi:putative transposase